MDSEESSRDILLVWEKNNRAGKLKIITFAVRREMERKSAFLGVEFRKAVKNLVFERKLLIPWVSI